MSAAPEETREPEPVTSRRGFFWVGRDRSEQTYGTVASGPMYVEWEEPVDRRHPYPIVLIHGGGGQGLDWIGTPDGRPGWAPYLVREGYAVYVVDRPGHGRAAFLPDVFGPAGAVPTYQFFEWLFKPPADGPIAHPAAELHTRWPGGGTDDAVFDQLVAAMGPMSRDFAETHRREQARGAELLDRIGPAVLFSHSAGGPCGWLTADARPDLVRAIVALEPMGPPFLHDPDRGLNLAWGPAAAPLTYDPPVSDPSELRLVSSEPPAPGLPPMVLQEDPARKLRNLAGIPIAVVSAEASRFVHFDGYLPVFLEQAGCDVELVRLGDRGIHGNAHGMIFEENHREVLGVVLNWLEGRLAG